MTSALITIRPMRPDDLDAVVAVHRQAFPGFFMTRMGPAFLRAYYQTVLDCPGNIAHVAGDGPDGSPVIGFAVGFSEPQTFYTLFRARRRQLLPSIALAALRDPGIILQIVRNARRVGEQQEQFAAGDVELASIGVAGQGAGVGGLLVNAFVETARAAGANRIRLTTDRDGNDTVRSFYERRSFELDGFEDRGGRMLCRYTRSLG